MTVNQQIIDLVHKPNDWYSPTVEYVGKAYARFSNPKGWIRGKAICKYDEIGNGNIEMEVEEWENEEAPLDMGSRHSFTWLAVGYRPHLEGEWVMIGSVTNANVCDYFELKTEDGIYIA